MAKVDLEITTSNWPETHCSGYSTRLYRQDPDFYQIRKRIRAEDFTMILAPIMLGLAVNNRNALKILDLGCGDGTVSDALEEIGKRSGLRVAGHGLDLDPEGLKLVTAPVRKTLADIAVLPYSEGCLDMVCCTQVIEHLTDIEIKETFHEVHEVYRVLKPGGLFYLETPNPDSLEAQIMGRDWPMILHDHLTFLSPQRLNQLLGHSGFAMVRTGTGAETDEQVNELWEIARRVRFPGIEILPWKMKLGFTWLIVNAFDRGSITTGLAKKPI